MEEKHLIDYAVAIGTIATPFLVLLLTAVGWKYRQSMERRLEMEERLRDDRIETYNQILEPFIILLMPDAAWQSDKRNRSKDKNEVATSKMLSLDYRKTSFSLSLIGSDSVVGSYNDLMQHFYRHKDVAQLASSEQTHTTMRLLGSFLLEIRKSMGNEATTIDNVGMLEWFITDANKIRDGN